MADRVLPRVLAGLVHAIAVALHQRVRTLGAGLQWLQSASPGIHVSAQHGVDPGLIAPALFLEPFDDIPVKAQGDGLFGFRHDDTGGLEPGRVNFRGGVRVRLNGAVDLLVRLPIHPMPVRPFNSTAGSEDCLTVRFGFIARCLSGADDPACVAAPGIYNRDNPEPTTPNPIKRISCTSRSSGPSTTGPSKMRMASAKSIPCLRAVGRVLSCVPLERHILSIDISYRHRRRVAKASGRGATVG